MTSCGKNNIILDARLYINGNMTAFLNRLEVPVGKGRSYDNRSAGEEPPEYYLDIKGLGER
jgi:hypothetical protein